MQSVVGLGSITHSSVFLCVACVLSVFVCVFSSPLGVSSCRYLEISILLFCFSPLAAKAYGDGPVELEGRLVDFVGLWLVNAIVPRWEYQSN
jgi:hypothetical protein